MGDQQPQRERIDAAPNIRSAPGSPLAIIIERDYSKHEYQTQFSESYPEELRGKITPEEFAKMMRDLNEALAQAERISFYNMLYGCLGCITCWILFHEADRSKRKWKEMDDLIARQNQNVFGPKGLRIENPRSQAFLQIRIVTDTAQPLRPANS